MKISMFVPGDGWEKAKKEGLGTGASCVTSVNVVSRRCEDCKKVTDHIYGMYWEKGMQDFFFYYCPECDLATWTKEETSEKKAMKIIDKVLDDFCDGSKV